MICLRMTWDMPRIDYVFPRLHSRLPESRPGLCPDRARGQSDNTRHPQSSPLHAIVIVSYMYSTQKDEMISAFYHNNMKRDTFCQRASQPPTEGNHKRPHLPATTSPALTMTPGSSGAAA